MTTIRTEKNISFHLDLAKYPTLHSLKTVLASLCGFELNSSKKILKYTVGKEQFEIRCQRDYDQLLNKKNETDIPELFLKENLLTVHHSFSQNIKRLFSLYKKLDDKQNQKNKYSKVQRKIHGKQMTKGYPKQDWQVQDWQKWAQTNVDEEQQREFIQEIRQMFQTSSTQSIVYKTHQMNDDLLKAIQSNEQSAIRYNHSENGVSCLMYSIYSQLSEKKGIAPNKKDLALWKLGFWKDNQTTVDTKRINSNFKITHQANIFIPIIEPLIFEEFCTINKHSYNKLSLLFPNQPLSDENKKLQFKLLDLLHYGSSLLFQGQLTQLEFKATYRQISDDQFWQFVNAVALAKKKYKDQYIHLEPTSSLDGILPQFNDDQRIAIVGDWGSGLSDAADLLEELVAQRGATVVIHLGDVYYAGFERQYQLAIALRLENLRSKGYKFRYYTIPGNHDFYTNGGPFYNSLKSNNVSEEDIQKFGFFCLRNKSHTWQFIGLDTGYSGSSFYGQANVLYTGDFIYEKQLAWAKEKINGFEGQTILLTHHQAFSAYDSILGKYSNFGYYDKQVNCKLSQQLFEITPKLSLWLWGHEHRLTMYKSSVYGIPCCRLVGNSSFQVHKNETYDINFSQFSTALTQYKPKRSDTQDRDMPYFDHTGCVLNFDLDKVNIKYVDMTSSYMQKSTVTRDNIVETISRPIKSKIMANRPYNIRDSSSLSWALSKNFIWLHYTPLDIIFEKVGDANYNGPITSGMELYIKVVNNNTYLYMASSGYLYTYDSRYDKTGKFKFYNQSGSSDIFTGDTLILLNNYYDPQYVRVDRYYCSGWYYLPCNASGTEPTFWQIYDRSASNTTLPQ